MTPVELKKLLFDYNMTAEYEHDDFGYVKRIFVNHFVTGFEVCVIKPDGVYNTGQGRVLAHSELENFLAQVDNAQSYGR